MDRQARLGLAVDVAEEVAEVHGPVAGGQLADHLPGGGIQRHLTVDIAGLTFADSASIQAPVLAARTLHERGGEMVLLSPQPIVARVLSLMGSDQMTEVRLEAETGPEAEAI